MAGLGHHFRDLPILANSATPRAIARPETVRPARRDRLNEESASQIPPSRRRSLSGGPLVTFWSGEWPAALVS